MKYQKESRNLEIEGVEGVEEVEGVLVLVLGVVAFSANFRLAIAQNYKP